MRASITISALAAFLPLTQACYRVHGTIQQYTNTATFSTTYLPSIYVEKDNTVVCDGHFTGEEENPWNAAFIPGGIPTNTSFSGPWGTYNCSTPDVQVDVFGILGLVLVRDYETAFYVTPDALAWSQPASGEGLAGNPDTKASVWTFDSGNVHC
jgi:hypothetical protein